MPFIPHTPEEVREMLAVVGVGDLDSLFDEIPPELRLAQFQGVPDGVSEMEVSRLMAERAARDRVGLNFVGAGAYEHHIPAAVWQIATRGEYYTAYTPYQAEASQGTLQVIYEYQSMMAELTAMDVSNASLYDGASGLAEAVLMAVRSHRKSRTRRILMPAAVHPAYRATTETLVRAQGIDLVSLPYDPRTGTLDRDALARHEGEDITAVVIPQPNFFGLLEEVDELSAWARRQGALSIAVVNPLLLSLLKPPGEWGGEGVDIVCGEGQPLGIPLSSGGPYCGFLCTRQAHVRQMPGRLVGRTVDADGRPGFVLTLQAREQHIRRSKATSNICTNQGLMVTAATIHMALLGAEGLERVAATSYRRTHQLVEMLAAQSGVRPAFDSEFFHECALRLGRPAEAVLERMAAEGVLGGYPLGRDYPGLEDTLLVCATETKSPEDLARYAEVLGRALEGP